MCWSLSWTVTSPPGWQPRRETQSAVAEAASDGRNGRTRSTTRTGSEERVEERAGVEVPAIGCAEERAGVEVPAIGARITRSAPAAGGEGRSKRVFGFWAW